MTTVRVSRVEDFAELGARWRDLEQRADGSFFQSWTWVGCLATERFPDPVLVEATEDGRTVALALFNRIRSWIGPAVLHLGASGIAELDCPYVEHNGVLAEAGREAELAVACLRAVASRYDLALPGINEPTLAAVRRTADLVRVTRSQPSPFVDLTALRNSGGDYPGTRSANTRQQIRRSDRSYQRHGPIEIERAGSAEAALAMLDEMATLHQATWQARGQPGSFARPFFRRFHRELIRVAAPRGEVALLRVFSNKVIGVLYNFVYRGEMLSYQSGFAYGDRDAQAKPGLTCHARAIHFALTQGLATYDFLAGEDRYKRSLANSSRQQIWAMSGPFWSPHLLVRAVRDWVR